MNNLYWNTYYNIFSRVQGQEAHGEKFMYRILPERDFCILKIFDRYTGNIIKVINFDNVGVAESRAEKINFLIKSGFDISKVI